MLVADTIALILVIVGALNWGSVGLFGVDVVSSIFGAGSILARVIFSLVGIAGLWAIPIIWKNHPADTHKN